MTLSVMFVRYGVDALDLSLHSYTRFIAAGLGTEESMLACCSVEQMDQMEKKEF